MTATGRRQLPLHSLLTRLISVCVIPLVLLATYLAFSSVMTKQAESDREAANLAKNFATSLDQYLAARIGALHILAQSPLMDDPSHWEDLYREAQGFHQSFGTHVILADPAMHMLFNTRAPFGTRLPRLPVPKGRAAAPVAMETGMPAVGDIFQGPIAHLPLVAIAVPAKRGGRVAFLLITTLETRQFQERLNQVVLPPGWCLSLLDSNRGVIARCAPQGMKPGAGGGASRRFAVSSSMSPWSVVLEIPSSIYRKPLIHAASVLALVILIATLASILGGVLTSRRLGKAITSLVRSPAPGEASTDIEEIAEVRRILEEAEEQRRAAEAARLESEQRYRLIAENTSDVIWLADIASGRFTFVSPSVERLRGYTPEEVMAQTMEQALLPETYRWIAESLPARIARFQAGDESMRTNTRNVDQMRKDGSLVSTEVVTTLIPDGEGLVAMILGVSRDITERKRAEEEMANLASAIEQAAECVVITDQDGTIRYVNPVFEQVTGYAREEAIGQNPRILKSGEQGEAFYDDLWKRVAGGETWSGRFVNRRKDGTLYHEDATISPIKDSGGGIVSYVAVKRDITKEVELEEQLRRSQKLEAIGTLAGGIAHDFNNILSIIIGYAELTRDALPPRDSAQEMVDGILQGGMRAKDLVKQILTFSRQVESTREPVMIHLIAKETVKLLRSSIPKNITITDHIDPAAGAVEGNPARIHQMLMNLCTNASHAMTPGGGEMTLRLEPVTLSQSLAQGMPPLKAGKHLHLVVSDTGCGMDEATMARIFDPFFTTKEKGKGTGLGLATVYGIVAELGGAISVSSEVGRGSTFSVYLPVSTRTPEKTAVKDEDDGEALSGKAHILIVDDEESIVHFARIMLEGLGYTVTGLTSSTDALMLAQSFPDRYDLVITDYIMPEMNGEELAREILTLRPDMPIIIMTGYSENMSREKALALGIRHYIEKPFSKTAIGKMIRESLGAK